MSDELHPQVMPSYSLESGDVYDLIYSQKDYRSEVAKLTRIINESCESGGHMILEAACGTGNYMQELRGRFIVDGFDLSENQVVAAKKKLPDAHIIQADMVDVDMGKTYDVVLCLFSSIGYLKTKENLNKAVANLARHTKSGGLVIIEPWLDASTLRVGLSVLAAEQNDTLRVARMGIISQDGIVTTSYMHDMVGSRNGIQHFIEKHELAMYSYDDFTTAFNQAGLDIEIDREGLIGRGLCIGKKTQS